MPCRRFENRSAERHATAAALPGRWPGGARRAIVAVAALIALGGCGTPLPPISWVRLPVEPVGVNMPPATAQPVATSTWQLMAPVTLPGHLDRDALLVPQGAAGVQPLGGVRWAEPLRDAVPRLLRQDLARRGGQPVWTVPLPAGVSITHQLRVEIGAFDVGVDGRSVQVQARWSVADARGAVPPRLHEAAFTTPAAGGDASALAAAHRLALWELAGRISATARP